MAYKPTSRLLTQLNITKIAQRRALDLGVEVQFDSDITVPSYTPHANKITFPTPPMEMSAKQQTALQASYIHEPLHATRRDTSNTLLSYSKGSCPKEFIGVWNCIEDDQMELAHCRIYRGDAEVLSKHAEDCLADITSTMISLRATSPTGSYNMDDESSAKMLAVFCVTLEHRAMWQPQVREPVASLKRVLPDNVQEYMLALDDAGLASKLKQEIPTEQACHELAKDVFGYLFPNGVPPGNETPTPPPEEATSTEGEATSTESEATEKADVPSPSTTMIHWTQLGIPHDMDTIIRGGSAIDWDGKRATVGHRYKYTPPSWTPEDEEAGRFGYEYPVAPDSLRALANEVRQRILSLKRTKIRTEQVAGKLHNRNLYRVAVPRPVYGASGGWHDRVFKKTTNALTLDCCVTLLIDFSGSMQWDKVNEAIKAACTMLHLFDRVLHVPCEVLTFSAVGTKRGLMTTIKPFSTRSYTEAHIMGRFGRASSSMNRNADADCLVAAYQRILKQPQRRKVIFVLSDGSPTAGGSGSDWYTDLRVVVETITKENLASIYGIGIESTDVSDFYPSHVVLRDSSKIGSVLLELLERSVINHAR